MVNVFIFHLNSIFMSLISISIWNPQMFDINCSFEFWELWLMSISFLSLSPWFRYVFIFGYCMPEVVYAGSGGENLWMIEFRKVNYSKRDLRCKTIHSFFVHSHSPFVYLCVRLVCVYIFCLVSGLISEFHCDKWRNSSVSMHKVQKILYSFIFVQFISVKYCLKCEPSSLSQVGCHCFVCRTS